MAQQAVTVLAYHRIASVDESGELAPSLIDASPADFEAQMRYVAGHYNVISAWELVRALREGYKLPGRALIITFDDAYRCFADTALPILRRLGLPVTLFAPTYYIGAPGARFWWDALYKALANTGRSEIDAPELGHIALPAQGERMGVFNRIVAAIESMEEQRATQLLEGVLEQCAVEPDDSKKPLLGWDELAELAESGVAVGPHTRRHPILSQVSTERLRSEVEGSWEDLRAHIKKPLPIFCYPNGKAPAVNGAAQEAVRGAGLAGAFTMTPRLNVIGRTNPFMMYRIGAVEGESLTRFRFKIGAAGRVYRRVKGLVAGR